MSDTFKNHHNSKLFYSHWEHFSVFQSWSLKPMSRSLFLQYHPTWLPNEPLVCSFSLIVLDTNPSFFNFSFQKISAYLLLYCIYCFMSPHLLFSFICQQISSDRGGSRSPFICFFVYSYFMRPQNVSWFLFPLTWLSSPLSFQPYSKAREAFRCDDGGLISSTFLGFSNSEISAIPIFMT